MGAFAYQVMVSKPLLSEAVTKKFTASPLIQLHQEVKQCEAV